MNPSKGYFCLNEIDFGMLIETPLMSAAREKTSPQAFRALVLEGRRFSGPAALEAGIVDAVGATVDEAVKWVGESGKNLWEKGKSGVYGRMREESLRRTVEALQDDTATKVWRERLEREKSKLRKEEEARVKDFEGAKQKAKL
jgi:enoyl-CoA hydratase/carnithine racemase